MNVQNLLSLVDARRRLHNVSRDIDSFDYECKCIECIEAQEDL